MTQCAGVIENQFKTSFCALSVKSFREISDNLVIFFSLLFELATINILNFN